MGKRTDFEGRKHRRVLSDPTRFLRPKLTFSKKLAAEEVLEEIEHLFDSHRRGEACKMLLAHRKQIRRELKSPKQSRFDFRTAFARISAKMVNTPDDLDPVSIDSFCLEIYRDLQNLIDWFEENATVSRLREVKRHVKMFFSGWAYYYCVMPGHDDPDRVFKIQILSDLVTQKHKHPAHRAKIERQISKLRNALKPGRFRYSSEPVLPDCSGILKIFRFGPTTFAVFKRQGEPAALFPLGEMAEASLIARAKTQQVLQENLQGLKGRRFPEVEEQLRNVATRTLWTPLRSLHGDSDKPIVVLRESSLHDFLLHPKPPEIHFLQYKNYLVLFLREELKSRFSSGINVVVGDQNPKRNPIVNREVGIVTSSHEKSFPVSTADHLAEIADQDIQRLYAIGHSWAPAEFGEEDEALWPLVQIANSFVDLHSLRAIEVIANGCDLGSAFKGDDGLWTSLPDAFIARGSHTVIAPVMVTSQFWALGLMAATRRAEAMGMPLIEAFEHAREMILSGSWSNSFTAFMDQNIKPFLKDLARERAKTVAREIDPLMAMNEFPPADLVEWHTTEDIWRFGQKVVNNPDRDPVEIAEEHFFDCGMRIWNEVRADQRPQPFASMILDAGYRIWGGL